MKRDFQKFKIYFFFKPRKLNLINPTEERREERTVYKDEFPDESVTEQRNKVPGALVLIWRVNAAFFSLTWR